ncbi:hypothetical protein HPP92_024827 [Vanilla planifolia]|uniref:Protein kinase domain-containing protein n=1 Tax=Vanilla planifolia TaxID=51239 RepID=A0A835PIX8_VANPL|nr:hypothetical protein HPP92_024827 [Vanilla planifolia]
MKILGLALVTAFLIARTNGLGSAATVAIISSSGTVCGILAGGERRSIQCTRVQQPAFSVLPDSSFNSLSGGRNFFCGLSSGRRGFFCWNAGDPSSTILSAKRVYNGSVALAELSLGDDQICAFEENTNRIRFWRGDGTFPSTIAGDFRSLTSGRGFSCAIGSDDLVQCWGGRAAVIQTAFRNTPMTSIVAGDSHVCGITDSGFLVCEGSNNAGQLNVPSAEPFQISDIALGTNHSCALKQPNGTVLCWGGGGDAGRSYFPANGTTFISIVAGGDLTCGLTVSNFTVLCWKASNNKTFITALSLPKILPGICVPDESSCKCGVFPGSESFCPASGVICKSCISPSPSPPLSSPSPSSPSPSPTTAQTLPPASKTSKSWIAFAVVGSVGTLAGTISILYCIWTCVCRRRKVHNSIQLTIAGGGIDNFTPAAVSSSITIPNKDFIPTSVSKSGLFRSRVSRMMERQSFKEHAKEFLFFELATATENFSLEFKIGAGSFGTVYRGILDDGREVAIKRREPNPRVNNKFLEEESAFQSELAFLSRLHHKHLVGFVGYCDEGEERLLVYEYMKNGALYKHLHSYGGAAEAVKMNSWKMRIKVLLDASRGIDYLHNYAVPPIIHRDIKSSNILLDSDWVAKVSDFGLSLMGPSAEGGHLAVQVAGTVGYLDPEYYALQHLTTKSDVYGFGVVMLEVLTGRRAIFREEGESDLVSVVDYAVPAIAAGQLDSVLDPRLAPPAGQEGEAIELVAYTAMHCVNLEGKGRPAMADVVMNLESALSLFELSQRGSQSSDSLSFASMDQL